MAVRTLEQQIRKLNLKDTKLSNGMTLPRALKNEANRLYKEIQKYINNWYRDYEPVIYDRTGNLKKAIYVEDIADIEVVNNTIKISLCIHDDLDYHRNLDAVYWTQSYWYDGYHEDDYVFPINDSHLSSTIILMDKGWDAPKLEWALGRKVYLLTWFEGIHFIERGIEDFLKSNPLGLNIVLDNYENRKLYR